MINKKCFGYLQKDLLTRIRKQSAREDYENRNRGKFRRIFPCDDRIQQESYVKLLSSVFGIFNAHSMQKDVNKVYNNRLRVILLVIVGEMILLTENFFRCCYPTSILVNLMYINIYMHL